MLKKYWKLIVSSIVIILPTLVALMLKEYVQSNQRYAWHFTWVLPVILVLFHVLLYFVSESENKNNSQNPKIMNITYWAIPGISVYISALFMALSLGFEFSIGALVSGILGVTFIILGNYMPKAVRNRVFGIRVKWTLMSDENWAATHRFASKIWVALGALMLLGAFLPDWVSYIILPVAIIPAAVIPTVYSYVFYKRQQSVGAEEEKSTTEAPHDKRKRRIILAVTLLLIVVISVILFVGNLSYTVGDDYIEVNTTFGGGTTVDFDDISYVEFRYGELEGTRVAGFATFKLLFGTFKNDEFGAYHRYTYAGSDATIIIYTVDDDVVVLAAESVEETEALYDTLSEKLGAYMEAKW